MGFLSFVPQAICNTLRFEALASLREEGLIRHLGLSNVDTTHLAEARAIAPVVAVQNHFHIARREDVATLNVCTENGIAFAPFFPLDLASLASVRAFADAVKQRLSDASWRDSCCPALLKEVGWFSPRAIRMIRQ
jgi:aryl-alcohol dehydrogenase-like predicted oxidoreductase